MHEKKTYFPYKIILGYIILHYCPLKMDKVKN